MGIEGGKFAIPVIARSVSGGASGKHLVIPGRRVSGEPGIFFNPARFRIGAESAFTRVFDALWRRPE
jgi:hypothetical protein